MCPPGVWPRRARRDFENAGRYRKMPNQLEPHPTLPTRAFWDRWIPAVAHMPEGRVRLLEPEARRRALQWLALSVVLVVLELWWVGIWWLAIPCLAPLVLAWDAYRHRFPTVMRRVFYLRDLDSLPPLLKETARKSPVLPDPPLLQDRRQPPAK